MVGIRGAVIGTQRIINQFNETQDVKAYLIDNKVNMSDMEKILGRFTTENPLKIPPKT